jgi:hypothetical protein
MVAGHAVEFLEDLGRQSNGRLIAIDVDGVIAGSDTHAQRVTNAAEVRVAGPKDGAESL